MTDHEHNFLCPILCDEYAAENAEREVRPSPCGVEWDCASDVSGS